MKIQVDEIWEMQVGHHLLICEGDTYRIRIDIEDVSNHDLIGIDAALGRLMLENKAVAESIGDLIPFFTKIAHKNGRALVREMVHYKLREMMGIPNE